MPKKPVPPGHTRIPPGQAKKIQPSKAKPAEPPGQEDKKGKKVYHTLTNVVPGSRVTYVRNNKALYNVDPVDSSRTVVYEYRYKKDLIVQILIIHLEYKFVHLRDVFLGKENSMMQVQQDPDHVYNNQ